MAEEVNSGASAPPDVTDEEHECKICYNFFNLGQHVPKLLSCSHTFCRFCLDALHSQQGRGWRLGCPVCRQWTPVPEHRVDKLPDNTALTESLSLKKPECPDPSNAEVQAGPAVLQERDDSCQTCRQVAFVTGCAFAIFCFLSTAVLLFLGLVSVYSFSHATWPVGLFVASGLALLSVIVTWLVCMLKSRRETEARNFSS